MRDRRGGTGEGDSIEDALVCLFGIKGMGMGLNLVLTEMRALRI